MADSDGKSGATREVKAGDLANDGKSSAARLVSTSRCIIEAINAEYE